jgi:hypothetical protein
MRSKSPVRRVTSAGALLAVVATLTLVAGTQLAGAVTYPPLTLSKTTAHSGTDHGDSIDVSGAGCDPNTGDSVVVYLAKGVVADSSPLDTALTGSANSALPDGAGNWSTGLTIPGGGFPLASGQYTVRAGCYDHTDVIDNAAIVYAGVVIVINGAAVTTTTAAPTTTAAAATTTTAAAAPVAADPAFTG